LLGRTLVKKDKIKKLTIASVATFTAIFILFSIIPSLFTEHADAESFTQSVSTYYDNETTFHFISTGNSDSILIENNGLYALIDSGDIDDDITVKTYLQSLGVTRLEYLIITHFHSDHLGAADTVLRNFIVETTLVSNGSADTFAYYAFINALSTKGQKASVPIEKMKIPFGSATLTFFNTYGNFDITNNNSLVTLVENGNDKILLMGDAQKEVEATLNIGPVDLLKVGHHGSSTSSTESFIQQVSPKYAVITVGIDNPYGHPHAKPINVFRSLNIPLYRTDEQGHLIFTSTGDGVITNLEPGTYNTGSKKIRSDEDTLMSLVRTDFSWFKKIIAASGK
ncbi:MAG: ComEC/Rec2 family competence protein, partial [Turicibacter sp.]